MASSTELLGVYLNDHLAGSVAALELIRHSMEQNEGTALGAFLGSLRRDIEEDSQELEQIMASLGVERSTLKRATSWLAEKASRVKFDERLTRSAELSRVLELEAMSLGIEGKLSLWKSLKAISGDDPRLAARDFDRLMARAREQLDGLEVHRLEAVTQAFGA